MTIWLTETASEEVRGREHTYTIGIKARAFRKNGSLRAIPPGFSASGELQLPHGREGLLNTRITDRLNPGHNPQIHIGRGQNHIRMSALGTSNVAGAPVYDGVGNIIGRRYNGAWTGADLEWIDIGHRVKKHIYLHAGHPRVFEIRVDDRAGNLVASPRGWDLLDDNGNPVLFATPGYLFKPSDPSALTLPVKTTVRVQGGKSIYTYTLPEGDLSGLVLDPTWESQPGAAEGMDTYIQSAAGSALNFGIGVNISVGSVVNSTWRGLLSISLSSLSPATVVNAALALYCAAEAIAADDYISLHRGITQWWEGFKDNVPPDVGQDGSTWDLRNANGAVAWAGGAGGGSGTDYTAVPTDSQIFATLGTWLTYNVKPDVVAWFSSTANYGWWLQASENPLIQWKAVASSDNVTAAYRPKLTVVWVPPGGGSGRGRVPALGRVMR